MIGLHDDTESALPAPAVSTAREVAAQLFSESGLLHHTLGLEHRAAQETMARAVAHALVADQPLLFEAGTGVGKSLAYLLPGIVQAMDQSRQLIVSTHTIALQEQLETKDLPLCRRIFGASAETEKYASFKSCVLVGKSNYLCTSRLAHALADRTSLLPDDDYTELKRIADWAETSETGLRHDLKPPPRPEVWEHVNADSSGCSRKHCDPTRCFYQRARARLRAAHVVVVNHALLFALINAGGAKANGGKSDTRGVLFPDDFLVLDEGHTVPEVATENFGLHLSSYGVDRLLKHLHNPRNGKGLLSKFRSREGRQLVEDALEASQQFFDFLASTLLAQRPLVRLREKEVAEPLLDEPLAGLHRVLGKLADQLDEGRDRDALLEQRNRVKHLQASLNEWLTLANEGHVYWAERSGKRQTFVALRSAPIDIAPALRQHLFGCGTSVVCTSATLAISGSMEVFAQRIGADDALAAVASSPFDYARNMRVYVAADIPLPSPKEARLALDALTDYVDFCVRRVEGGTLVLFTSYSDMRAVAVALEPKFQEQGRPFLLQGESLSRTELAREMRLRGNAVLFGTESFWMGIDVPGNALSQVIVTRLPFDPPTHPILEARSDRIREAGGNPFAELTLPDALIKFRQGIGRLIRSTRDRGLITILDSRVLAKTYGRQFLESLPQPRHERITRENRAEVFQAYPTSS